MENTLYQTSLSLQQPIFTWGKISNGVKALKEVESVRSLQLTDTENQLNAELKSRLSAIYYMDDIISLLNEQKSYADRLVELAHAAQEQGQALWLPGECIFRLLGACAENFPPKKDFCWGDE